jgi:hypothetical protein
VDVTGQRDALRSQRVQPAMLNGLRARAVFSPLLARLGELESAVLRRKLAPPRAPIYVTGLARGGTTITLELLAEHRELTSHRYADIFNPFMPFAWNWMMGQLSRFITAKPFERAQADGLVVTPDSPENAEEILWTHYFPRAHDEDYSSVLDASTSHPRFERAYADTLSKLLLARRAERYLSKSNYNLTRLEYLLRLFPDARFVVILRNPLLHVAGLVKAHMLYQQLHERDPSWTQVPVLAGHWDFGPAVRFIHVHAAHTRRTRELTDQGRLVEAYALYWHSIFDYLRRRLAEHEGLRRALLVVRHEDLCAEPRGTLARIAEHCALDWSGFAPAAPYESRVALPNNYSFRFSEGELESLHEVTKDVAATFGYVAAGDAANSRRWTVSSASVATR